MFRKRKVAGDRVVIDPKTIDWKAIAKELINEHDLHCEADREDGRKPLIACKVSIRQSERIPSIIFNQFGIPAEKG